MADHLYEFRGEPYQLRLFDDVLLEFDFVRFSEDAFGTYITGINDGMRHLLPFGLRLTDDGLLDWLQSVVVPRNRAHVDAILEPFGLSVHDIKGIIDISLGLSLTDSYWVTPSTFEGSWASYNLYENHFSEVLSLIAYTGQGVKLQRRAASPELTTNGSLPKAWRFIPGEGLFLYKGGTSGFTNTGWEPFNEVLAFQVAEAMGLKAVAYELVQWKGITASRCRHFTSPSVSFVPVSELLQERSLDDCFRIYAAVSPEALDELRSMLLFDCVIYNQDRHFGNFGLLRDSHSGKLLGAAPIFDNGYSLFNFCGPDRFTDDAAFSDYLRTLSPACTKGSFTQLALMVKGSKQHQQLRALLDFHFTIPSFFPMPQERIYRIESQIRKRASELLALPILSEPAKRKHQDSRYER